MPGEGLWRSGRNVIRLPLFPAHRQCDATLAQPVGVRVARGRRRGKMMLSVWNPFVRTSTTCPRRASPTPRFGIEGAVCMLLLVLLFRDGSFHWTGFAAFVSKISAERHSKFSSDVAGEGRTQLAQDMIESRLQQQNLSSAATHLCGETSRVAATYETQIALSCSSVAGRPARNAVCFCKTWFGECGLVCVVVVMWSLPPKRYSNIQKTEVFFI